MDFVDYLKGFSFFVIWGGLALLLAYRLNFFKLPSVPSQDINLKYPLIGLILYLGIFFFDFTPLNQACVLIVFSLFQGKERIIAIWKDSKFNTSLLADIKIGALTALIAIPCVTCLDLLIQMFTYLFLAPPENKQLAVQNLTQAENLPSFISFLFVILVSSFFAPLLEEVAFRGFLQTYLKKKWGFKWALLTTSFIFALFHFSAAQGSTNLSLIPSIFFLALFLGFLYERERSLLASIALHMTFNSISVMRILLFKN